MKNILFPTDFSDNAQNAYYYALQLAKRLGASITTLHVYEAVAVPTGQLAHTLYAMNEQEKGAQFAEYKAAAKDMHRIAVEMNVNEVDVPVNHLLIEHDEVVETIIETAKKEGSDMIVLGTKGASGLKEIFIGSVASAVIEKANCPVLAIPENADYKGIEKIAFTTNFEDLEEVKLNEAIRFAKLFDADTYCLHINVRHTYYAPQQMATLKAKFTDRKKLFFEVIDGLDILDGIEGYIARNDIDVLAMLTHKQTFLQKIFSNSYAKQMAFHSKVPLLVFHETDEV